MGGKNSKPEKGTFSFDYNDKHEYSDKIHKAYQQIPGTEYDRILKQEFTKYDALNVVQEWLKLQEAGEQETLKKFFLKALGRTVVRSVVVTEKDSVVVTEKDSVVVTEKDSVVVTEKESGFKKVEDSSGLPIYTKW